MVVVVTDDGHVVTWGRSSAGQLGYPRDGGIGMISLSLSFLFVVDFFFWLVFVSMLSFCYLRPSPLFQIRIHTTCLDSCLDSCCLSPRQGSCRERCLPVWAHGGLWRLPVDTTTLLSSPVRHLCRARLIVSLGVFR
jgi:hypothetical protein